jgi:hypothetical protein
MRTLPAHARQDHLYFGSTSRGRNALTAQRKQVILDAYQKKQLDDISRIELGFPHDFLNYEFIRQSLSAGTQVRPR